MIVSTISPAQLGELCRAGENIELIDVRTPVEFREVHVEVARNIPLDRLDAAVLMQARAHMRRRCSELGALQSASWRDCEPYLRASETHLRTSSASLATLTC